MAPAVSDGVMRPGRSTSSAPRRGGYGHWRAISGEATSSPSPQLSKQRFTRLHDYLRHLGVRSLEAGHDAVWHQQLQLLVVERAQS